MVFFVYKNAKKKYFGHCESFFFFLGHVHNKSRSLGGGGGFAICRYKGALYKRLHMPTPKRSIIQPFPPFSASRSRLYNNPPLHASIRSVYLFCPFPPLTKGVFFRILSYGPNVASNTNCAPIHSSRVQRGWAPRPSRASPRDAAGRPRCRFDDAPRDSVV